MDWEPAARVQKNAAGEFRALIGDAWVPVARAQKDAAGNFRVMRSEAAPAPAPAAVAPEAAPPTDLDQRRAALAGASGSDMIAGSLPARLAIGVAKPIIGAAQLGADAIDWGAGLFGYKPGLGQPIADSMGTLEGMQRRGMKAWNAFNPMPMDLQEDDLLNNMDIAGTAASMAVPGKVISSVVPKVTKLVPRILQGAAVGGVTGATTPKTTAGLEDRLSNEAAIGTAIGAAIPFAAPGVSFTGRFIKNKIIDPLFIPENVKQRMYLEAAGTRAPEVINAMRNPTQLVPGSVPTAGEAAAGEGVPTFSALQANAARILPTDYLERSSAQKAAQIGQVRTVGKTPADIKTAEAARTAQADLDYPAAMAAGVQPNARGAVQAQIDDLMQRPAMKDVEKEARALAKNAGAEVRDVFDTVEGLDYLKKALDAKINVASKPTYPQGPVALKNLLQMKTDLLEIAKTLSPDYNTARANFAAASKPLDQMALGQFLENKLVPALGEETAPLRANMFSNAVREAPTTIKKALTDAPRYTELKQVLTPEQLAAVESVEADLARQAMGARMATLGQGMAPNPATVVSDAMGGASIPNKLSGTTTIINALLQRVVGSLDKKLALEIAQEMLKPQTVAAIMEKGMAREARNRAIANFLARGRLPVTVAAAQNTANQ